MASGAIIGRDISRDRQERRGFILIYRSLIYWIGVYWITCLVADLG
jgi:hypothetical protein